MAFWPSNRSWQSGHFISILMFPISKIQHESSEFHDICYLLRYVKLLNFWGTILKYSPNLLMSQMRALLYMWAYVASQWNSLMLLCIAHYLQSFTDWSAFQWSLIVDYVPHIPRAWQRKMVGILHVCCDFFNAVVKHWNRCESVWFTECLPHNTLNISISMMSKYLNTTPYLLATCLCTPPNMSHTKLHLVTLVDWSQLDH